MSTSKALLHNNRKIPDSLYRIFAKPYNVRYKWIEILEEEKRLEFLPKPYNNIDSMAMLRIKYSNSDYKYEDNKFDSVVFVKKHFVKLKGDTGWVYYYKYKPNTQVDKYKLVSVGLIPQKVEQIYFGDKPDAVFPKQKSFFELDINMLDTYVGTEPDTKAEYLIDKNLRELYYKTYLSGQSFYRSNNKQSYYDRY